MSKPSQNICLNMIVKNERHVIERCLASVKEIISSWAIVDTGSEDGTQQVIREFLKDIPGTLVECPWKDFAHNRTEALTYVPKEAEYILIVDADEEIKFDPGFEFPLLDRDCYFLQSRFHGMHYYRMQLVKNGLGWRWEGKLHEYITSTQSAPPEVLQGMYDLPHPDGFRSSNPNKYKQDALVLEQAILEEPNNARYIFYLAQSYRDCGDLELALRYYTQRVRMEGWEEEVWYSLYQIALLKAQQGEDWAAVQMSFLDAYNYRPNRAEPLLMIIEYYRKKGAWPLAYFFANQAIQIPYPSDLLFIKPGAYGPQMWLEYAYSVNGIGEWEKTIAACNAILSQISLSPEITQQAITLRLAAQDMSSPILDKPLEVQRKFKVFVECHRIDLIFDNCINSLLHQQYESFEIVCVISEENETAIRSRVSNLPSLSIHIGDLPSALSICETDDYVFLLNGNSWLVNHHCLSMMNQVLNERAIHILYGQHLTSSGKHGNSLPKTSATFLGQSIETNQAYSWVVFQASRYTFEFTPHQEINISYLTSLLLDFSNEDSQCFFMERPLVIVKPNL